MDRPSSSDDEKEITPEMIDAGVAIFEVWRNEPDNAESLEQSYGIGDARVLVMRLFLLALRQGGED